jgi:hypothetical protein
MKSYAIDKYGLSIGGRICGNIVMMRKKLFNAIGHVTFAPNRYVLDVFGGDMTIEAFRANATRDRNQPMKIDIAQPIVPMAAVASVASSVATTASMLKLKRSKPLKRNHNNLESMLGLVITHPPQNS